MVNSGFENVKCRFLEQQRECLSIVTQRSVVINRHSYSHIWDPPSACQFCPEYINIKLVVAMMPVNKFAATAKTWMLTNATHHLIDTRGGALCRTGMVYWCFYWSLTFSKVSPCQQGVLPNADIKKCPGELKWRWEYLRMPVRMICEASGAWSDDDKLETGWIAGAGPSSQAHTVPTCASWRSIRCVCRSPTRCCAAISWCQARAGEDFLRMVKC